VSSRPHLVAYCLSWHLAESDAFQEILVRPLRPFLDVELVAWDGVDIPHLPEPATPLVFCQLPPPSELLADERRRLVWIPMWDHAARYDRTWWESLPPTLRVVAFSGAVAERSRAAGLPTLALRFYMDPAAHAPARWEEGPVVFYWNRTGLVDPGFLARTCSALGARELVFRPDVDPRIDLAGRYELPRRLGETAVRSVSFSDRESYLRGVEQTNVFLAPRRREGVGLTVVEALARGCAVLACDEPTMNEYIEHGRTGFLFRPPPDSARLLSLRVRAARTLRLPVLPGTTLPLRQDWDSLSRLDLAGTGDRARGDHAAGYEAWVSSLPRYSEFVAGG
jgi:hypothetical protein